MEIFLEYSTWASLLTLTLLEIVLGIDNVVFIALVVQHLPAKKRARARTIGLILAMVIRIIMLLGLAWIMSLTEPLFSFSGKSFSGKDLMLLAGGLFLIYKGTEGLREQFSHEKEVSLKEYKGGYFKTIIQIILIDLVFSFDSVMTAVGITQLVPVIIIAMVISMIFMLLSSGYISRFIYTYPTLKVLAIAFVLLIGVLLIAEAFGIHVPRGYLYFGMGFSLFVETVNLTAGKRKLGHAAEASDAPGAKINVDGKRGRPKKPPTPSL